MIVIIMALIIQTIPGLWGGRRERRGDQVCYKKKTRVVKPFFYFGIKKLLNKILRKIWARTFFMLIN